MNKLELNYLVTRTEPERFNKIVLSLSKEQIINLSNDECNDIIFCYFHLDEVNTDVKNLNFTLLHW
jgi:hypothetical protein